MCFGYFLVWEETAGPSKCAIHGSCCREWPKQAMAISNSGRKGVIWLSVPHHILTEGRHGSYPTRAATWRQELMQRPWRATSYRPAAPSSLLGLLSGAAQDHQPRPGSTHNRFVPQPLESLLKNRPTGLLPAAWSCEAWSQRPVPLSHIILVQFHLLSFQYLSSFHPLTLLFYVSILLFHLGISLFQFTWHLYSILLFI